MASLRRRQAADRPDEARILGSQVGYFLHYALFALPHEIHHQNPVRRAYAAVNLINRPAGEVLAANEFEGFEFEQHRGPVGQVRQTLQAQLQPLEVR